MGRRTKRILPGLQAETFGYDLTGNLVRNTNFNGMIITNQFDVMNRMTNRSSAGGYQLSFAYSPTGQRTNMNDSSGSTGYAYDSRDRLQSKRTAWTGGLALTLNYGYDPNGNLTNLWSSPSGGATNYYQYDALNRLTNVQTGGAVSAGYGFDANGNLQSVRYGSNVSSLYQYDLFNRLTNSVWNSNTLTLASFAYQLGATGNRTNFTETLFTSITNRTYTWAYDALYRLTNENISSLGSLGYAFDPVSNRTNRSGGLGVLGVQNLAYSANDWLTTNAYDSNGNTLWTTNGGTGSGPYYYDVENRLTNYANLVYQGYNGDGIRLVKRVGSQTTCYLTDDRNPTGYAQVLEEWTASGGVTNLGRVYYYGLQLIGQRTPNPQPSTNYFIPDGHGSTRLLTDNSGVVANTFSYDAFGTLVASNTTSQTVYLYSGEQFDPDLGLYYLRARYYKPDTGRFSTMDSCDGRNEDPCGLHKYLYCEDNPVNKVDPTGHEGLDSIPDSASHIGALLIGALPISATFSAALSVKTLDLNAVILYYSDLDEARVRAYWKFANDIYAQAGIKIQLGTVASWDQDKTFSRTDAHYAPDYYSRDDKNRVMPGGNWASITQGQNTKAVTAYFSQPFYMADPNAQNTVQGMSAIDRYGSPPFPAVFIMKDARKKTLAHEIGHILGLPHREDEGDVVTDAANNLMARWGSGTELTQDQVTRMRTSKLLH